MSHYLNISEAALSGARAIAVKHGHPLPMAVYLNNDSVGTVYRRGGDNSRVRVSTKGAGAFEIRIGDNKVTVRAEVKKGRLLFNA